MKAAKERAAQIWAQLEAELVASGMAADKFLLTRAKMIRLIGAALSRRQPIELTAIAAVDFPPLAREIPSPPVVVCGPEGQAAGQEARSVPEGVAPPLPHLPASHLARREQLISAIDRRLNELIDQSIAGYSGDDSVGYR